MVRNVGSLQATVNYCIPLSRPPLTLPTYTHTSGKLPEETFELHPRIVTIHDLRSASNASSDIRKLAALENHGFSFATHKSSMRKDDWRSDDKIKEKFYPEVEKLLLEEVIRAKKVVVFGHTLSRSGTDVSSCDGEGLDVWPDERVRIDYTLPAAHELVETHCSEDDTSRFFDSNTRCRVIKVWKPISHTVSHHPLALADWRSVDPAVDLLETRHATDRYEKPEPNRASYQLRYNSMHRWLYLSRQTPEEVTLIQCCDSHAVHGDKGGRAVGAPHTLFDDPRADPEEPAGDAIEVRCLVFDDK